MVSIIIPTYKRSDVLVRAIESCLNQTMKDIEIIVVDDNQPDSEYRKGNIDNFFRFPEKNFHVTLVFWIFADILS